MQFTFSGFTEETGFRVFAFSAIAMDRSQTEFTVKADLALIRAYGIRVQELPLLCRTLLERCDHTHHTTTLIFTEDMMRRHASERNIKPRVAGKKVKAAIARAPATQKEINLDTSGNEEIRLNEEVWEAWVRKGKVLDQAAARSVKIFAGAALAITAIGSSLYFMVSR